MLVVAIYFETQIIKILLTGPGANSFPPYFRLVGNPDFYDHQLVCRNSHRFGIEKFIYCRFGMLLFLEIANVKSYNFSDLRFPC